MYGVSPYMGSWQDTGSFLDSEGLVMSFVGEGEHLLVASAVAKCFYLVLRAVERQRGGTVGIGGSGGQCLADAMHLFLAITVVALELAGKSAVNHFYLGA